MKETVERALVVRAQKGDTIAEAELVAHYRFLVATIISRERFFLQTGTQDDLMQHGFIGLLRAIRSYQYGRNASFKTYASTCIRNEIVSALRSESSKSHGALTTAQSLDDDRMPDLRKDLLDTYRLTPEERLLTLEYSQRLTDFINTKLTGLEREVHIRHAQGYTYGEIALQLDTTTKAVDGTIQRIRKKMARLE
jgi:RNA polymerase sporulation-specific sigma factor